MLSWNSRLDAEIDNLDGDHHHLYQEVLSSTGLLADKYTIPALASFPTENGYRDHVRQCLRIYERLQASSARIRVPAEHSRQRYQEGIFPGD